MRRLLGVPGALLALSGLASGQGIAWQTDLDAARTVARQQGKPLLVLFRCET